MWWAMSRRQDTGQDAHLPLEIGIRTCSPGRHLRRPVDLPAVRNGCGREPAGCRACAPPGSRRRRRAAQAPSSSATCGFTSDVGDLRQLTPATSPQGHDRRRFVRRRGGPRRTGGAGPRRAPAAGAARTLTRVRTAADASAPRQPSALASQMVASSTSFSRPMLQPAARSEIEELADVASESAVGATGILVDGSAGVHCPVFRRARTAPWHELAFFSSRR